MSLYDCFHRSLIQPIPGNFAGMRTFRTTSLKRIRPKLSQPEYSLNEYCEGWVRLVAHGSKLPVTVSLPIGRNLLHLKGFAVERPILSHGSRCPEIEQYWQDQRIIWDNWVKDVVLSLLTGWVKWQLMR